VDAVIPRANLPLNGQGFHNALTGVGHAGIIPHVAAVGHCGRRAAPYRRPDLRMVSTSHRPEANVNAKPPTNSQWT
jgi:hypothetical protein